MPPLHPVSSEQFAALREHFLRTGFTAKAIRERLQVRPDRELDICALSSRPPVKPRPEDELDALIQLFISGEAIPEAEVRPLIPQAVWEALSLSHLIARDPSNEQRTVATVALYPIRDLLIVSDRWK